MLPRADLTLNRPPASLESATPAASSTDARQEIFRRLTQITLGRELQATVDSMLDDGTFLVRVADTAARMQLPVGTKVGDTLSMVFIAKEPRPTFLLNQQGGSAPASLSTAGRLIDHVLQAAEQEGAPTAVPGKSPLIPTPAANVPERVAAALQDSLTSSGLFYESHLQQWISGSRPLADIQREPQASLPQQQAATAHRAGADQNPPELARLTAGVREAGESTNTLMTPIRDTAAPAGSSPVTDADVIARSQQALPTLDPESSRMINLQLNALEHQQVRWQGELWPGQKMEWEVSKDKQEGNAQQQEQTVWNSVVRFELPHLGNVSATIRLAGDRVHVQVNTASDDAAASLREHGGMLADALEAAGSPLDSLLVKRDEQP